MPHLTSGALQHYLLRVNVRKLAAAINQLYLLHNFVAQNEILSK